MYLSLSLVIPNCDGMPSGHGERSKKKLETERFMGCRNYREEREGERGEERECSLYDV